jgi:hypothetical protein
LRDSNRLARFAKRAWRKLPLGPELSAYALIRQAFIAAMKARDRPASKAH